MSFCLLCSKQFFGKKRRLLSEIVFSFREIQHSAGQSGFQLKMVGDEWVVKLRPSAASNVAKSDEHRALFDDADHVNCDDDNDDDDVDDDGS